MKTCWSCGAYVPDNAKFCRDCGANLAEEHGDQRPGAATEDRTEMLNGHEEKTEILTESRKNNETPKSKTELNSRKETRWEEPQVGRRPEPDRRSAYQQTGPAAVPPYTYTAQTPMWDHTAEFDPKDISDNKVVAMLVYLMGMVGILFAFLGANTSPYAGFHVRQGLKFLVIEGLMGVVGLVFYVFTILTGAANIGIIAENLFYGDGFSSESMVALRAMMVLWIAYAIAVFILAVLKFICFFSICSGKAKEPPIIREFGFLR